MAHLARIDFKPAWFTDVIEQKGLKINWYKALMCSCAVNNQSGQPDPNCPYCDGFGYIYQSPIELDVVTQSVTALPEFMLAGYAQFGELLITPKDDIDITVPDRIEFIDYVTTHTHAVLRKNGDEDTNRYPIYQVAYIFYKGTYYIENIDFEIDTVNPRIIRWLTANRPETRTKYTIRYLTHPRYLISKAVHEKRATFVKNGITAAIEYKRLPTQWIAKKEFELSI